MKKLITSALVIMAMIGFSGCEDTAPEQSPVRIEAKTISSNMFGETMSVPIVEVTAVVDKVTIENVIANNGNCKMTAMRQKEFPKTLETVKELTLYK